MSALRERLVVSPCSNPELTLDNALAAYTAIGFKKFEVFTHWVKSAADIDGDPICFTEAGHHHGVQFTSFHLPVITDDSATSLNQALRAAYFAHAIGAGVVLFKAASRNLYVRIASRFLDGISDLGLTTVLQNHAGSPLSSLDDVLEVITGIGDTRMKTLLEVGHFHSVGVSWHLAYEYLGDSIALIHIKDQVGSQSVPFGQGEVDLPGLFAHTKAVGYIGDFVVEMEVVDHQNTLTYLAHAVRYIEEHCS